MENKLVESRLTLPRLALVIPCYNEEEVLPETSRRLIILLNQLIDQQLVDRNSYVLLVDDGSGDNTWNQIFALANEHEFFRGLKLSRNFGHQHALLAGLRHVTDCDISVSVDADLQDDLNAIGQMILKYNEGAEIVYGVRDNRTSDAAFKKWTALGFYKLLSVMGVESVYNHADFRLMSRKVLDAFEEFNEKNVYLRGMIPMVGFPTAQVYYKRSERFAGTSKYNLRKMLALAWNGVSSLSFKPLRFVTFCGFLVFSISLILSIYALVSYFMHETNPGWTSIVLPMYFLGGIQLLCIGLLGEYIAKIYKEVKNRPLYIVEQFIGKK